MRKITVAKGDGIGPEIMDATLAIIKAAGAENIVDEIQVGEKVYLSGNTSGIGENACHHVTLVTHSKIVINNSYKQ